MHSYCLGDFYLSGYIKAGFVRACYRFDSSGIKRRVGENPSSQGGEMHHLCEWACFLSLICVWAAAKQHLGWLLMASRKWCEIKGCFWGHLCQFCSDLCCGAELRSIGCRWAVLQSPVCVTATEHLKLSFRRLGSKSGTSSWDCTEVSSKTHEILAGERALGVEDKSPKLFRGCFPQLCFQLGAPPAFTINQETEVIFSTSPHHFSFCPWFCTVFILGAFCQFMQVFKSIFSILRVDFTHGLSLQT